MSNTTLPFVPVLTFLLSSGLGFGFNILPDTVNLLEGGNFHRDSVSGLPRGEFIVNQGNDSLVLDSITVSSTVLNPNPVGPHLQFNLERGTPPDVVFNKSFWITFSSGSGTSISVTSPPNTQDHRIAIPPQETLLLASVEFDRCLACPLAKSASPAAAGDTLKAVLVFHSGTEKDSVLFLGIESPSSSITPFRDERRGHVPVNFFDLQGRKVRDPGIHRVVVPAPKR